APPAPPGTATPPAPPGTTGPAAVSPAAPDAADDAAPVAAPDAAPVAAAPPPAPVTVPAETVSWGGPKLAAGILAVLLLLLWIAARAGRPRSGFRRRSGEDRLADDLLH